MSISFINRSDANNNAGYPVTVSASAPSSVQTGDILVASISSAPSLASQHPGLPTGWNQIGSWITGVGAGSFQFGMAYAYYNVGSVGTGPWGFTNTGFGEVVIRAYRGVVQSSPVDQSNSGAWVTSGGTCTIGALAATAVNGEWYVCSFTLGGQPSPDGNSYYSSLPTDLSHTSNTNIQWNRFDGDKDMGNSGSTPGAESAVGANASYVVAGFAITLIPAPNPPFPKRILHPGRFIPKPLRLQQPMPPIKWI